MSSEPIYDEVEIEDMDFDEDTLLFQYPCPCGDKFEISLYSLQEGEQNIGICPSCSLQIRVIVDQTFLEEYLQKHP